MRPPRVIVVVSIITLGGAGVYLFQKPDNASESSSPAPVVVGKPAPVPVPPVSPDPSRIAMQVPKAGSLAQVPPNPMASAVGSEKVTAEREIAIVLELFQTYRREFGGFPAGQTNAHFMNALRGANPGKLPIFPIEHPRLDAAGNLVDRWHRPYHFHPVSRDRLEIRSGGADGELFTADDLIVPPQEGR